MKEVGRMAMDRHLVRMRADGIDAKKNKKKKTASGEKQSVSVKIHPGMLVILNGR
jgi:hypothetical protein